MTSGTCVLFGISARDTVPSPVLEDFHDVGGLAWGFLYHLGKVLTKAIMGHATYTGVPRDTDMAKALFATDELCGFLVACALVRPSRSLDDMEVKSVKKKLKDKAFARSVNREDIYQGVQELGVELDDHIRFVIDALRPVQKEIGLGPREEQAGAA